MAVTIIKVHTKIFAIPGYALDANPNLVQNPGYPAKK
jgi:hypothetical protein